MYRISFDIGGMGIKVLEFLDNKKIDSYILKYSNQKEGMFIHERTKLFDVLNMIAKASEKYNEVEIFIAIPGIVDIKEKKVLSESAIKEVDIDIKNFFSHYGNIKKFIIENDAKAAAIGEFFYRDDQKVKNQVHLTIGTSLGGAIIINEKIYKGSSFKAGEFSKIFNVLGGENNDAFHMEGSFGAIIHKYNKHNKTQLNGVEIVELAKQKDKLANKLLNNLVNNISKLVITLDYIFDYDLLTIGGGISKNPYFEKLLFEKIKKNKSVNILGGIAFSNEEVESKVKIGKLYNDAACYGGLIILEKGEKIYE